MRASATGMDEGLSVFFILFCFGRCLYLVARIVSPPAFLFGERAAEADAASTGLGL